MSFLLALALCLTLLPATALAAEEPGLCYLSLLEGPGQPLDVDRNSSYSFDDITMEPFSQRKDVAMFFYDGDTYTPVDVTLRPGTCVDLWDVSEHYGPDYEDKTGWYFFSPYDFTSGALEYTHTDGETYSIGIETVIPQYAFYAEPIVSQENYRMYALMTKNTNEAYADFQYTTTLYLKAENSSYSGFTTDGLEISCGQQLYNEDGFMVSWFDENGEEYFLKPVTRGEDYDYILEVEDGGKTLKVIFYANVGDLNFMVNKWSGNYWQWGSYVNLLVPDASDALVLNISANSGFETAKFLPTHVFRQIAAAGTDIILKDSQFPGDVTLDKDVAGTIAGADDVAFAMTAEAATAEEEALIAQALASGEEALDVLDLTLYFGTETRHELGGKAIIRYDCDLPNGTVVRVYYLNEQDELEEMEATFRNGKIIFSTDHFSKFVLVEVNEGSDNDGESSDVDPVVEPTPAAEPANPVKVEADGIKVTPRTAFAGETVTVTVKDGYDITDIIATDRNGKEIDVTFKNGKYTFKMPDGKVNITPIYAPKTPAFADVPLDHTFAEEIRWASEQGYMKGITQSNFLPGASISRQQIWMTLARHAGLQPASMAEAKAWAVANGITDGSNPGGAVTRQQLVTLLYRYAVLMGYDVSVGENTNILSYDDAFSISAYAIPAFQWACGAGVVNGTGVSTLSPAGGATRGQFAAFLYRFSN